MDESGNQFDDDEDHVSRVLEQWEIDEINMRELSEANRYYRMCVAGKCPPPFDRHAKQVRKLAKKKRVKKFVSQKFQDQRLGKVWVEQGRERRIKVLEKQIERIDAEIFVASGKTHVDEQEKNFKDIKRNIQDLESMDKQIEKAKFEISHLKSQFDRIDRKKQELSRETESEGKNTNAFHHRLSLQINRD